MNPIEEILKVADSENQKSVLLSEAMLITLIWEQSKRNVRFKLFKSKKHFRNDAQKDFERLLNLSQQFLIARIDDAIKAL